MPSPFVHRFSAWFARAHSSTPARASRRSGLLVTAALAGAIPGFVPGCKPETTNTPPIANAGPDQVAYVYRELATDGSVVDVFDVISLDGDASSDPDGDNLSRYFWSIDTVPVGSDLDFAALSPNNSSQSNTQFTPDHEGIYGLTLQVFDGQMVSPLDYVQIEVVRRNSAPTASAGPDLHGVVGDFATFDASSSIDPDGDFLSYRWELAVVPLDSALTSADLVYPATPNPRLAPDVAGVYALALVVSDGLLESAPDFVTVTVATGNQSPVVVTDESRTVTPCQPNPITLDGSSSHDPEEDPFTYHWSVLETPFGSFVDDADLTAPEAAVTQVKLDLHGLYVFGLTLDDGKSVPAVGTVAILFDNGSSQEPPQADPGGNRTVRGQTTCSSQECLPCQLSLLMDGGASMDPNGDPLTYAWEVLEGDGVFDDPTSSIPTLTGPSLVPTGSGRTVSATVEVQLTVSDCAGSSAPAPATVTFYCEGV